MNLPDPIIARQHLQRAMDARAQGRLDEALSEAKRATAAAPDMPEAWHTAGFFCMALGLWAEAEENLACAIALCPDHAVMRSQYALALQENGKLREAHAEVTKALAREPNNPEILMARADILDAAGYHDLAAPLRERCGVTDSNPTFSYAANVFVRGEHRRGLAMMAARDEKLHPRLAHLPPWGGTANKNLRLALTGSQGHGDVIMFLRTLPEVLARVGSVVLVLQAPLVRLVKQSFPSIEIVTSDEAVKDAQARCSLMRLPLILSDQFIPQADAAPYLHPDPQAVEKWQERLTHLPRPWIGISWEGNRQQANNHKRSVPVEALSPIVTAAKNHLISLQVGGEALESSFNAAPYISDFAYSSALLQVLDLHISVCSAPAHLAGAMGRPVWTMLCFDADWRWGLGRKDSFWYPSMRLFRQPKPGDWDTVINDVAASLTRFIGGDLTTLTAIPWQGPSLTRHPFAIPLEGL